MLTMVLTLGVWSITTAATIWSALVIRQALKEERLRDRHS